MSDRRAALAGIAPRIFSSELAGPLVQGDAVLATDSADGFVSLRVAKIDVGAGAEVPVGVRGWTRRR
jgi:hypothetical protein